MPDDPNDQALKDRIMRDMPLELLDIDTLIPLLNKYHLLTQNNMYDLQNRLVPPTERASALVHHILPSKGSEAFTLFVKCLQEEKEHLGHQELLKLFNLPLQCENADHQNLPTLSQQRKLFWCPYIIIDTIVASARVFSHSLKQLRMYII